MKKIIYLLSKLHKWHKDWKGCFWCEYKNDYESLHQRVEG